MVMANNIYCRAKKGQPALNFAEIATYDINLISDSESIIVN